MRLRVFNRYIAPPSSFMSDNFRTKSIQHPYLLCKDEIKVSSKK